jgi:hypothetical protein
MLFVRFIKKIAVINLFFCFPVYSEALFVPLDNLLSEKYGGQEVHTRGFLYPLNENESILALQPNLRSCCVVDKKNKHANLLVKGQLEVDSNSLVELVGDFKFQGSNASYPYIIENAYIKKNKGEIGVLTIFIGVIFFLITVFYYRFKLK